MKNKESLSQYFTPSGIAEKMCALSTRTGTALEPSSGDGAIFKHLFKTGRKVISIEKDPHVAHLGAIVKDFFAIPTDAGYFADTVVMNPPYKRFRDIGEDTRSLPEFKALEPMLGSANLYAYFLAKSIKHLNPRGELIAIIPVDFLYASSGIELRKWMDTIGVITKIVDLTDANNPFSEVSPDCIVFRFSLDCTEKPVLKLVGGNFVHTSVSGERLGSMTTVHVGAVPASKGLWESVGKAEELIEFEGSSGSEYYHPNALYIRPPNGKVFQLVANCKSRHEKPFRVLETPKPITGALLGIIPNAGVDIYELCDRLNTANWKGLFLLQGQRFNFGQRTLTEALV